MRRREFLHVIAGAGALWPCVAFAQQDGRVRRVGILIGGAENEAFRPRLEVFRETLRQLGWIEGQNLQIELRWGGSNPNEIPAKASELVRLKPDVILAGPTNAFLPVQRETRTIPIVFVSVSDPVGQGFVQSLARPGGNATGFSNLEFSLLGKWLQLIKEAAPGTKRLGLMISVTNASSPRWYQTFKSVAPTFSFEPVAAPLKDRSEIENTVKMVASQPNSALIVPGDSVVETPAARRQIIDLVAAHRLPAVYGTLLFAPDGGLISYGVDQVDPYPRAASYVDRILRGEKPADLPVQQARKFNFVINLKTAKALGLDLSPTFVGTADEVIE